MYYIGSFIPQNACNPHHNSVRQTLYDQNFVDDCWNSVCLGNIFPYIHKQKKARILKQDALIIYICSFPTCYVHFLFSGFLQALTVSQNLFLQKNQNLTNFFICFNFNCTPMPKHRGTKTVLHFFHMHKDLFKGLI